MNKLLGIKQRLLSSQFILGAFLAMSLDVRDALAVAVSSSWAKVDWANINITLTQDIGSSLSYSRSADYTSQYGVAFVNANNGAILDKFDVSPALTANTFSGGGPGYSYNSFSDATGQPVQSSASFSSDKAGPFSAAGYAFIYSFLTISGSGSGQLTVSMPYQVGATALAGPNDFADSWAYGGLDIADNNGWITQLSKGASLHNHQGIVTDYSDPLAGALQWTISVQTGTYELMGRTITSDMVNSAPVPEPSTFMLLGAGLAAVGFLRKRMHMKRSGVVSEDVGG